MISSSWSSSPANYAPATPLRKFFSVPYELFFVNYSYLLFLRQKQILCTDENENYCENYSQCLVLKAVEQEESEYNADKAAADIG